MDSKQRNNFYVSSHDQPLSKIIIVLATLIVVTKATICPPADQISPCICDDTSGYMNLNCAGLDVIESSISNLFSSLRNTNNVSISDPYPQFHIGELIIDTTALKTLDLTHFAQVEIYQLELLFNDNMTEIISGLNSTEESVINVELSQFGCSYLYAAGGVFTNDSITTLMTTIRPDTLTGFYFAWSGIQGLESGYDGQEYFPGLSSFTQLNTAQFDRTHLTSTVIAGGQFKKNQRLTVLHLIFPEGGAQIGPGAFLFDQPPPADMIDTRLEIGMFWQDLSDDRIHPDHGLEFIGRPTTLNFEGDNFEFISAENFFHFLLADERNQLNFVNNKFICDSRMQWVRDAKESLESRVFGLDCVNDPGETVFTTSLLH